MVFSKMNIISVKLILRDLKAYLHSKVMFSKINIFQKFPVWSNSVPQDQNNETISNRCQAMNSPRVEMKLTHHLIHRSQTIEKYLFYQIFVLPKFTLQQIHSLSSKSLLCRGLNVIGFMSKHERAQ